MAINASSITTSNTLEQLRQEFNNLVTDVSGLEAGTQTFTAITATTTTATTVNVAEDGTIVFEGATDDAHETTLTVTDPTADRTITLPNETGTVHTSGGNIAIPDAGTIGNASVSDVMTLASTGIVTFKDDLLIKDGGTIGVASATTAISIASTGIVTFVDDIIIKDAGTIGSSSDPDAMAISSAGVVSFSATTEASAVGTAAVTLSGGLGVAKDIWVGDDIYLDSDSTVIHFGDDQEVTLTHVADSGLTLKHTATADDKPILLTLATGETDIAQDDVIGKIAFQAPDEGEGTDAILIAAAIQAISEGDFSASSNATSLQFMTGSSEAATAQMTLTSGGDLKLVTDSSVLSFGADGDTTLTHTDGTGLTLNGTNKLTFGDTGTYIHQSADGVLDLVSDTELELNATTIDINGAVEISGTTTQTGIATSAAKDVFNASLSVKNGSTSAGFIEFFENSGNGTNKATLIGPASTADVTLTLPAETDTIASEGTATALAIALG